MKFVADVMLGTLVRRMRFEGYDVVYDNRAEDEMLLRQSRSRMLLTRDRELAGRAHSRRVYLVKAIGGETQMEEIRNAFPPDRQMPARCLLCNAGIRRIRKEKIEHLVPPFVYRTQESFYSCVRCRRIYWQGTHYERMSRVLE